MSTIVVCARCTADGVLDRDALRTGWAVVTWHDPERGVYIGSVCPTCREGLRAFMAETPKRKDV